MIADIFEKKLVAANIGLTPGGNLFRDTMPGDVSVGVMTREPLGGIAVDPYIEGWYKPHLQVIVRHHDPVEGRALANQVIKALVVQKRELHEATAEHGPCHLDLCFPHQEPIRYPRLESNLIEWSLNFRTAFGIVPGWR